MFYSFIILTSIKVLQQERSVSAVYYLIQGKQSIQSIQDANLFGLHSYYGIYKQLSKESFMKEIYSLSKAGYIQEGKQDNYFELTNKGKLWLEKHSTIQNDLYFNGMVYRQIDSVFFARLLLIIQVWTNSVKKQRNYIPIVDDSEIENWVKLFYQQTKTKIPTYLEALYGELCQIFESMHESSVEIFLLQLSSFQRVGLSAIQLSQMYEQRLENIHLITMNMVHRILTEVTFNQDKFPVLFHIGQHLTRSITLTKSARRTDELLQQGWTVDIIAHYRRLKINTIQDHIVEIAIQKDEFPLDAYVLSNQQKTIAIAIEQVESYTLKEIKSIVGESISYFQIRLFLAVYNKLNV